MNTENINKIVEMIERESGSIKVIKAACGFGKSSAINEFATKTTKRVLIVKEYVKDLLLLPINVKKYYFDTKNKKTTLTKDEVKNAQILAITKQKFCIALYENDNIFFEDRDIIIIDERLPVLFQEYTPKDIQNLKNDIEKSKLNFFTKKYFIDKLFQVEEMQKTGIISKKNTDKIDITDEKKKLIQLVIKNKDFIEEYSDLKLLLYFLNGVSVIDGYLERYVENTFKLQINIPLKLDVLNCKNINIMDGTAEKILYPASGYKILEIKDKNRYENVQIYVYPFNFTMNAYKKGHAKKHYNFEDFNCAEIKIAYKDISGNDNKYYFGNTKGTNELNQMKSILIAYGAYKSPLYYISQYKNNFNFTADEKELRRQTESTLYNKKDNEFQSENELYDEMKYTDISVEIIQDIFRTAIRNDSKAPVKVFLGKVSSTTITMLQKYLHGAKIIQMKTENQLQNFDIYQKLSEKDDTDIFKLSELYEMYRQRTIKSDITDYEKFKKQIQRDPNFESVKRGYYKLKL